MLASAVAGIHFVPGGRADFQVQILFHTDSPPLSSEPVSEAAARCSVKQHPQVHRTATSIRIRSGLGAMLAES